MAFELNKIVRENVRRLVPYSSARSEYNGVAGIFLDANENSFGSPIEEDYSRYPDPLQAALKTKIARLGEVDSDQIFIGNGSDEAIDLLIRVFCRPGIDNIVICPPTYGMYEVAAAINDVAVKRANLTRDFELDTKAIEDSINENTKLIFFCSPNNPTGNCVSSDEILSITASFDGIVVVDEAYIHFSAQPSLVADLGQFPNLVVLQTFSKAWGLAGLRLGVAYADRAIISLLNKIKPPYNVSEVAQNILVEAMENKRAVEETIAQIKRERCYLAEQLGRLPFVQTVYPSDANFLLVRMKSAATIYRFLSDRQVVVRDRSNVVLCEECLRITVGRRDENESLLNALAAYQAGLKLNA